MSASISYQRSRFATQLPADRRYTASHYWLLEEGAGVWRVGFTAFAIWLLGDPVELEFSVRAGQTVAVGQEIGSLEGLKALTSIHAAAEGEFLGSGEITLLEPDPYGGGWLYRILGKPVGDSVDAHGYIAILDEAVDGVIRSRPECGGECEG